MDIQKIRKKYNLDLINNKGKSNKDRKTDRRYHFIEVDKNVDNVDNLIKSDSRVKGSEVSET